MEKTFLFDREKARMYKERNRVINVTAFARCGSVIDHVDLLIRKNRGDNMGTIK